MSESQTAVPIDFASCNQWTDICLRVLVAPVRTFEELSEHTNFPVTNNSLDGAAITVLLAHVVSGLVTDGGAQASEIPTTIFAAIFGGAVSWFGLAAVLTILSGWLSKSAVPYRTSLLCIGWTFLPMIFQAPLSCFRLFGRFMHS